MTRLRALLALLALLLAPTLALAQPGPSYQWVTLLPRAGIPGTAVNGTCWTQTAGLFCQINGSQVGPYVTAGGASLIVGSTPISGGAAGRVVYDNGGLLGEYTATQLTAQINAFTASLSGAVPSSGGGTSNFLRADGSWAAPAASLVVGSTPIGSGTNGRIEFNNSGVLGELATVGSGSVVLGSAASTTVNGQTCSLGGSCTVTAAATGITVGTTTVGSGTNGDLLYDNAGNLGNETISLAIDGIGSAQGDLLYRGASAWAVITPGTSGQVLQTQGASANPQWASVYHDKQVVWCGTCIVAADTLPVWVPQKAGTIASVTYLTGGSTPSFTANVTIAGASMTGCNAVSVTSATATTTTCTGSNTFTAGQQINVVTSSITGSPSDALVQINYTIP